MSKRVGNVETKIQALAKALAVELVHHRLESGDIHASWEDMLPNGGESLATQVHKAVGAMMDDVEAAELKARQVKARLFPGDDKFAAYR